MAPTVAALETAAGRSEAAAETAIKAAQEAKAAVGTAQTSSDKIVKELQTVDRVDPRDRRPQRFVIFVAICLLSLVGALIAGSFVPAAFTDPSPDQDLSGTTNDS